MIEVVMDDARALKQIDAAIAAGSDLSPVWRRLGKEFEIEQRKAFGTAGKSSGANWAALAESTKKRRLKSRGGNRGTVSRPLWDKGDLRRSLVQESTDSVIVVEPHEFRRGTSDRKARWHHGGFKIRTAGERSSLTGARSNVRTRRTTARTVGRGRSAGTIQVPARPLFGPAMKKRLATKMARMVSNHLVGKPITAGIV